MKIVKPTVEDVIGSIEVQYKAWLATYPNEEVGVTIDDIEDRYKSAFTGERFEKRKRLITNPEPNEKFILAKNGEKVVGMCYGEVLEDRNQLRAIYVLPEYYGKGIGTSLWQEMQSFFNENKDVYVEVVNYNKQAINFYKKLGFVDTGRRFQEERFRMKSGALFTEMEMILKR